MVNKGLSLFNECASEYVHLSCQEEECTSSPLGDSKMYTLGTSNKFTEDTNWIKQKWYYCYNKDFNGTSNIVKHLKIIRIISNGIQISYPMLMIF